MEADDEPENDTTFALLESARRKGLREASALFESALEQFAKGLPLRPKPSQLPALYKRAIGVLITVKEDLERKAA